MDNLIAQLLRLAVLWTGYAIPDHLPDVERVRSSDMPCACIGFFQYERIVPGYGSDARVPSRLMLREDVDTDEVVGRSILLHELVHALQAQRGPAEFGTAEWHRREQEAYRVQFRFLRRSGVAALPSISLTLHDE